jgi:hypothetical protein
VEPAKKMDRIKANNMFSIGDETMDTIIEAIHQEQIKIIREA